MEWFIYDRDLRYERGKGIKSKQAKNNHFCGPTKYTHLENQKQKSFEDIGNLKLCKS